MSWKSWKGKAEKLKRKKVTWMIRTNGLHGYQQAEWQILLCSVLIDPLTCTCVFDQVVSKASVRNGQQKWGGADASQRLDASSSGVRWGPELTPSPPPLFAAKLSGHNGNIGVDCGQRGHVIPHDRQFNRRRSATAWPIQAAAPLRSCRPPEGTEQVYYLLP